MNLSPVKIKFSSQVPIGYSVFNILFDEYMIYICKWYMYPIYRIPCYLRNKKYLFYYWLHEKRLMECEAGERMSWRNLKLFKKMIGGE
jgi:hypothetical protein